MKKHQIPFDKVKLIQNKKEILSKAGQYLNKLMSKKSEISQKIKGDHTKRKSLNMIEQIKNNPIKSSVYLSKKEKKDLIESKLLKDYIHKSSADNKRNSQNSKIDNVKHSIPIPDFRKSGCIKLSEYRNSSISLRDAQKIMMRKTINSNEITCNTQILDENIIIQNTERNEIHLGLYNNTEIEVEDKLKQKQRPIPKLVLRKQKNQSQENRGSNILNNNEEIKGPYFVITKNPNNPNNSQVEIKEKNIKIGLSKKKNSSLKSSRSLSSNSNEEDDVKKYQEMLEIKKIIKRLDFSTVSCIDPLLEKKRDKPNIRFKEFVDSLFPNTEKICLLTNKPLCQNSSKSESTIDSSNQKKCYPRVNESNAAKFEEIKKKNIII